MSANRLSWFGMLAAVGSCVLVAGCQSTRQNLAGMSPPREDAPKLNAAQKADLQYAFARSLEKNGNAEQVMAAYFGASGITDAFLVAFRIPNLLRDLFAEGAFSSAFVPTFVEANQEINKIFSGLERGLLKTRRQRFFRD